jgi:hypothetical protein
VVIHTNPHDGKVHVHDCPDHPTGSRKGGSACFWEEHDAAFKAKHKVKYIKAKKS